MVKCKYCGKECKNATALLVHENSCKKKQGAEGSGSDKCKHTRTRLLNLNDPYEKAIYEHEGGKVKYVCLDCEEVF